MDNGITVDALWSSFRAEGGASDFRKLFNSCYAPLCRYAYLILKDRMDSEEIVLDLFLYMWKNKEKIDIGVSAEAYLFRSVRNRCLNFIRTKHPDSVPIDDRDMFHVPPSLSDVDMEDIRAIVQSAVVSLPPKCREVFRKSRQEGLSNAEIAFDMGISIKAVEAHITKALKFLRVQIKDFYLFLLLFL